ncbi:MAG: flagellar biosynthesis anti-sigma factor FlgM [Planctomycetota bacterium]
MSDIAPLHRLTPPATAYTAQGRLSSAEPAAGSGRAADRLELSDTAKTLSKLVKGLPEIREGLVAQVRAQIAAGTYETPEKIDATVDALARELA